MSSALQSLVPYADVAWATAYFAARLNTDPWDAATGQKQLAALKVATQAIDNLNFAGDKHDQTWLAPPAALPDGPTLTPGSGGSLGAGTYNVALAFCFGTATGNFAPPFATGAESKLGAPRNANVGAAGSLRVQGNFVLPFGACGVAIYVKPPSNTSYFLAAFTPTGAVDVTLTAYLATAFASAGTGQVLPCANQPNQFPRGDDTDVPDDIKAANCELAFVLLDDVDPNLEMENLRNKVNRIGDGSIEADTSYAMAHVRAGIPSIQAWMLLKPYLRNDQNPEVCISRGG